MRAREIEVAMRRHETLGYYDSNNVPLLKATPDIYTGDGWFYGGHACAVPGHAEGQQDRWENRIKLIPEMLTLPRGARGWRSLGFLPYRVYISLQLYVVPGLKNAVSHEAWAALDDEVKTTIVRVLLKKARAEYARPFEPALPPFDLWWRKRYDRVFSLNQPYPDYNMF